MWTMSAKKPEGFKVEVFGADDKPVHSAWYQDRDEARQAGEHWQRLVLDFKLAGDEPIPTLDDILSDDELLAELGIAPLN